MRHRKATLTIEGMPLVTVPVGLANARRRAADVSLNIVFPDGRKAKQVYRNEVTGEVAESRPATRGIKTGKDEAGDVYGLVDMQAWDELNSDIKLHIEGFVPREEIALRMDRIAETHYVQVQPGFDAGALAMILRAMEARDAAAVVNFAVGKKERLGAMTVRPDGVLVVETMEYAENMTEPDDEVLAPAKATVAEAAVEQAEALIDATTLEPEVLDTARDETLAERRKLVEAAARGEALPQRETTETPDATQDLAAALAASLPKPKGKGKAKAKVKA